MQDEASSQSSLGRFATLYRLYSSIERDRVELPLAFSALAAVAQGGLDPTFPWNTASRTTTTVWSVVFRPATRSLHVVTSQNRSPREIHLDAIDFSAGAEFRSWTCTTARAVT